MKLFKAFLTLFSVSALLNIAWADEPGYQAQNSQPRHYRARAHTRTAMLVRNIWGPYGRLDTAKLACSEARSVVAYHGAAVMDTTIPNQPRYLFDRYVSDASRCSGSEVTRPVWVPTLDSAQCFIGYTCYPMTDDGQG